jgi:hypothetical protein
VAFRDQLDRAELAVLRVRPHAPKVAVRVSRFIGVTADSRCGKLRTGRGASPSAATEVGFCRNGAP